MVLRVLIGLLALVTASIVGSFLLGDPLGILGQIVKLFGYVTALAKVAWSKVSSLSYIPMTQGILAWLSYQVKRFAVVEVGLKRWVVGSILFLIGVRNRKRLELVLEGLKRLIARRVRRVRAILRFYRVKRFSFLIALGSLVAIAFLSTTFMGFWLIFWIGKFPLPGWVVTLAWRLWGLVLTLVQNISFRFGAFTALYRIGQAIWHRLSKPLREHFRKVRFRLMRRAVHRRHVTLKMLSDPEQRANRRRELQKYVSDHVMTQWVAMRWETIRNIFGRREVL